MLETRVATAMADGDAAQAADKLIAKVRADLADAVPALVMVFASTKQPLAALMPIVSAAFPTSTVLGASTAGEFIETGDAKGSAAIFALCGDYRIFSGLAPGEYRRLTQEEIAALKCRSKDIAGKCE